MRKIKVSEATDIQIDWLVAKCWYSDEYDRKRVFIFHSGYEWARHTVRIANQATCTRDLSFEWEPTTDWSQGGPIIERERIEVRPGERIEGWFASIHNVWMFMPGPTALIAAMRCYVVSKLGDKVEIPDELI